MAYPKKYYVPIIFKHAAAINELLKVPGSIIHFQAHKYKRANPSTTLMQYNQKSLLAFTICAFAGVLFIGYLSLASADTGTKKPPVPAGSAVFQKPSERVEADLAQLHTDLKITPQQESVWLAYADFRRRDAQDMDKKLAEFQKQHPPPMGMPGAQVSSTSPSSGPHLTVLELLQQQQDRLAEAKSRLDGLTAAIKPLYAALTPAQQAIADDVLLPHRPVMMAAPPPPSTH